MTAYESTGERSIPDVDAADKGLGNGMTLGLPRSFMFACLFFRVFPLVSDHTLLGRLSGMGKGHCIDRYNRAGTGVGNPVKQSGGAPNPEAEPASVSPDFDHPGAAQLQALVFRHSLEG